MSIQLYKVAVCRNQQINTCNITYSDEDNDNDDDKSDKIKLTVKYCFNIKGATFIFTMTLTVVQLFYNPVPSCSEEQMLHIRK